MVSYAKKRLDTTVLEQVKAIERLNDKDHMKEYRGLRILQPMLYNTKIM